jgi:hypothetical protein
LDLMVNLWCEPKKLYGEIMVIECIVVFTSSITYTPDCVVDTRRCWHS